MMDGTIECQSTPGEGSVFAPEDDPAAARRSLRAAVGRRGTGSAGGDVPAEAARVLLAEDHPVNQKVIEALLGEAVELTGGRRRPGGDRGARGPGLRPGADGHPDAADGRADRHPGAEGPRGGVRSPADAGDLADRRRHAAAGQGRLRRRRRPALCRSPSTAESLYTAVEQARWSWAPRARPRLRRPPPPPPSG